MYWLSYSIHIYYMYRTRSQVSNYLDRPNYTHCIKFYQVTGQHACFMLCILSWLNWSKSERSNKGKRFHTKAQVLRFHQTLSHGPAVLAPRTDVAPVFTWAGAMVRHIAEVSAGCSLQSPESWLPLWPSLMHPSRSPGAAAGAPLLVNSTVHIPALSSL